MNEQVKQDLKNAWDQSLPIFKSIAFKVAMAVGVLTWLVLLVGFLCTMFWVGFFQLVLTVAGCVVWFKYSEIVSTREYEEKWNKRRGY
jgi:hypothetical protein